MFLGTETGEEKGQGKMTGIGRRKNRGVGRTMGWEWRASWRPKRK